MTYLKFDIKLFSFLFSMYIIMTIIGTISHEFGHYSVSKFLGYEARINYKSSSHWGSKQDKYLRDTYKAYKNEIINGKDFPEKEKYATIWSKHVSDNFLIILGGPLQTILTGTISLLFLLTFKNRLIQNEKINFVGWVLIILSLFWLRQVANLFMGTIGYLKNGKPSLRGDEMRLALHLDINVWTIQILTGIIGLFILWFITFRILPKKVILTFLISGLLGGVTGYYLWLIRYGQYIMP